MTSESSMSILDIPRPIDANNDDTDNVTSINKVISHPKQRGRGFIYDDFAVYLSYQKCIKDIRDGKIDDNNMAKKDVRTNKNKTQKIFYKCCLCDKQLCVVKHSSDTKVTVQLQDAQHHNKETDKIPAKTSD
ncbi:unnamed protein product [Brachionus calyciflorus]|uniref:Uncharacterized protein n=1 Tax=Brachionus calyciflorus TaxID=104777 RepID=A0A814NWT0_9BILA|nr:unnamed protein product [Brachionus calyciflorus]